jgi:hypothetical protein
MTTGQPLAVLQRIRQNRAEADSTPVLGERCELCAEPISAEHGHVADPQARSLMCACRGCYLLFTAEGAGGGRFRAVPDEYRIWPGAEIAAADWEALQIPVSVAFFFVNSSLGRIVAFYPGPAGATESQLPLGAWDELTRVLQPDVQAVLVRVEPDRSRSECYVVPIDACYELTGRLRQLWRGFDGGQEARLAIDAFFARVRERAR